MSGLHRKPLVEARQTAPDAMLNRERQIMALWDAGHSIEAIAAMRGESWASVERVVDHFQVKRCQLEANVRRGSEKLLKALHRYDERRAAR